MDDEAKRAFAALTKKVESMGAGQNAIAKKEAERMAALEKQLDEFASTKRKGKPEHVSKSRTKKSSSRSTARKSPTRKSTARKTTARKTSSRRKPSR